MAGHAGLDVPRVACESREANLAPIFLDHARHTPSPELSLPILSRLCFPPLLMQVQVTVFPPDASSKYPEDSRSQRGLRKPVRKVSAVFLSDWNPSNLMLLHGLGLERALQNLIIGCFETAGDRTDEVFICDRTSGVLHGETL